MAQNFVSFDLDGLREVDLLVANLLDKSTSNLNEKSLRDKVLFNKMKPNEVEQLSYQALLEVAPSLNFSRDRIHLVSGFVFPDIILDKTHYGVEIKSTLKDSWLSTGSSIIESTREIDTDRIYMLFAKLGGQPEFRCKPYQNCLSNIAVTHAPRYLINMEMNNDENIFAQMQITYDNFRALDQTSKISFVRSFYKKKASLSGKHEMPWWMGGSTNINLRLFSDLDLDEKRMIEAKAFILFPSLFNQSRNKQAKYKDFALWLCTNYSLLCTNMRDLFTAGGSYKKLNGKKLLKPYPHIVGELLEHKSIIKEILEYPDSQLIENIKEFWDIEIHNHTLYDDWVGIIESKFLSEPSLKHIPIRNLMDNDALLT